MADYFLADVHLRYDRPDRGRRLARLVDGLGAGDSLTVVGDLCDFWLASRQRGSDPSACPGLRSLDGFRRRGGRLTTLAGNHDACLSSRYARWLGATWVDDSLRVESHGLRISLVHGHRLGGRGALKAALESRAFMHAFGMLPGTVAGALESRLDRSNDAHREAVDARHLDAYRRFAGGQRGDVDLVVIGHVHRTFDEPGPPRLVVPGGWHRRGPYLRVDGSGARLFDVGEMAEDGRPGVAAASP